jgi:hypothetical protein
MRKCANPLSRWRKCEATKIVMDKSNATKLFLWPCDEDDDHGASNCLRRAFKQQ